MDLNLTADETQFRDEFRAWLAKHTPKDWEHRRDETVEQHFAFLKTWQRTLYDGGWAGISWPREYGGRGASLMQQVIFWQEMALAGAPPMANVLGLGLVGPTLIAFGTGAQKSRYLRKILSAEEIWCQGFSEPNAGSDLAGLQRKHASTAATTSSTDKRSGRATGGPPTGASWSCGRTRLRPNTRA